MTQVKTAKLVLENGTEFLGKSFGHEESVAGEVVFNTGMSGYVESFTDPSYLGQIFTSTYPLIGNYGVPDGIPEPGMAGKLLQNMESEKVQISALIVNQYSEAYSHRAAQSSLGHWLVKNRIPALSGIDTRSLTQILRENGTMLGKIVFEDEDIPFFDPNKENLVAKATTPKILEYGSGDKTVVLVDCGAKYNIIRMLNKRGFKVKVLPWDYDFNKEEFSGLMISNGPGDPKMCDITVNHIRKSFAKRIPTFGICLGHQLLSLAAGADTYKLKYGHRSQNQPVREAGTEKCLITSQNHGYAVEPETLGKEWKSWFENLNDRSNEGIKHKNLPFMSVQFHPEASPGPEDADYLFDVFTKEVRKASP